MFKDDTKQVKQQKQKIHKAINIIRIKSGIYIFGSLCAYCLVNYG